MHTKANNIVIRLLAIQVMLILAAISSSCQAQQILIDRGVRVANLWCFPLVTNPKEYLYLPTDGRLSVDKNGRPQFSFMRYVVNVKGGDETPSTITEAPGGGVLHFLAEYSTPEEQVSRAQTALRKLLGDEEIKIRGPVIFASGRYAIISSIAKASVGTDAETATEKEMVATGNAPVLEGNRIAVSFDLDKQSAQILYNSFQMANPDISVVFEMQFEGLHDAYDATVDIDWSQVRKDQQFSAGVKAYFIGAEVDIALQRLMQNNAIRLVSRGEHSSTEALLNTVYSKILELLFSKTEEPPPPSQQESALDSLTKLISGASSRTTYLSLTESYRLKEMSSSGHTVLNFNHQAVSKRTALITFNIGDLYKKYGEDGNYFKSVNLADPIYSQREVLVSVDGSLLNDFDKYINSVSVTIKKDHENGTSTIGEVVVDRNTFTQKANRFSVVYGWDGDKDRAKWLEYQYRVRWSFLDGAVLEEDWRTTNSPMINVVPPYERHEVSVEGDPQTMKQAGVRYSLVKVSYDFFGKTKTKQILIRVKDKPVQETIELIQPKGEYRYTYEVKWGLQEGQEISKPPTDDSSGIIFIDEMPG